MNTMLVTVLVYIMWSPYTSVFFPIDGREVLKIFTTKGKAIPVTACEGPLGCETSRLPHYLDNRLTDGVRLSALHTGCPLPPRRFLVHIFVRG
jgi:hypothetical protein